MDLNRVAVQLPRMAWLAFRTFFRTLALFLLLGIGLGWVSYYLVQDVSPSLALLAGLLAFAEALLAGFYLAGKRAVSGAVIQGLVSFEMGKTMVGLVFNRLLGVAEEEGREPSTKSPEESSKIQGTERLPVAQAEERLEGTVWKLAADAEEKGGWQGQIQKYLQEGVRKITLTFFRKEATTDGEVDLVRLKSHLEKNADSLLIQRLRYGLRFTTILATMGLLLLIAAQIWLLRTTGQQL